MHDISFGTCYINKYKGNYNFDGKKTENDSSHKKEILKPSFICTVRLTVHINYSAFRKRSSNQEEFENDAVCFSCGRKKF